MMRSIGLPEIVLLCGILFLFCFPLILLVGALRGKQSRAVQRALIDKIPANELAGLLQTPQGERLVMALSDSGPRPGRSILISVQRGIVVILSGLGFIAAAAFARAPTPLWAIGILVMFVGIGLLVAAFVSYQLSKRWHLLEENGDASRRRTG